MPRQSPIPDDLDRPFYEAANEGRLVLQHCSGCDRWQHPPKETCPGCDRSDTLAWRETDGRGTIYSYGVIFDTAVASLQPDQPFNAAVVELDSCPGVNTISMLPGTPVDEVEIGARVELTFVATASTDQKIPEWRVADSSSASKTDDRLGESK